MMRNVLLLALCGAPLAAQTRADSASEARGLWRETTRAYTAHDYATARDRAVRAATVWPVQGVYVYGAASLSARMSDTASAIRWLDAHTALGLGADVSADDDFAPLKGVPGFEAAAARARANLLPMVRSDTAFTLEQVDFYPEGIACAADRTCYVSSVRYRKIMTVSPSGRATEMVPSGAGGLLATLGLALSADGRTLWAGSAGIPQMAGYAATDSGRALVAAFDTRDGHLLRRLLAPAGHVAANPGDLFVAASGEVFVSDSRRGAIYRVPRSGDTLEVFAESPLLCSPQQPAESADGKWLYVPDYCHGMLAVNRATHEVKPVAAPRGTTTLGIDGMLRVGADLIGVQNGVQPARIVRLHLSADPLRIERLDVIDRHLPDADQPTSGALRDGRYVYIADSHWDFYGDDGMLKRGAVLRAPLILRLPLNPAGKAASD
jgi:hypothetical protein